MKKIKANDLALIAGALMVSVGIGMIYIAAGVIALGAFLLIGGWLNAMGEGGDDT